MEYILEIHSSLGVQGHQQRAGFKVSKCNIYTGFRVTGHHELTYSLEWPDEVFASEFASREIFI